MIREKFDENDTDFDFYRYRVPRKEFSQELKRAIRLKMRATLLKFFKAYQEGEADIPRGL